MPKPSTNEIHAAIAAFISANSSEPYGVLAKRLNISVSTVRRVALKFGITRRQRLNVSVLDTIRRESGDQNDAHHSHAVGTSSHDSNGSHECNAGTGGTDAEL